MMNRILFICFFISYSFSNNHFKKCDFSNHIVRVRPQLDTFFISQTGHFKIHYDTTGLDAPSLFDSNLNNIPDYVEEVAIIADSSRKVIVDIMGFNSEPLDDDGIYDIYIEDRGPGSYGFNALENSQTGSTYIVIDDEYEESDYHIPGINTMRLTVAHEFFHAVQRSYRVYPNNSTLFLYEMSSTWIEDVIVPDGNDYLFWVDTFFNNPSIDIDDTDGYSIALFGHYLTQVVEGSPNLNSSIIKEVWNNFENINNGHLSIENVLIDYNTTFAESWTDFCARNLFNGKFPNMNNSIYYYSDQIYSQPILSNSSLINESIYFNDIIINDKSIAPISSFTFDNFFTLNLNTSIENSDFFGIITLDKNNNSNPEIINLNNISIFNIEPQDTVNILFSSYDNNQLLDVEILLDECDISLLPEGYCDCSGNTFDCNNVCGGDSELDLCGVCGGDNSLCTGCTDPEACNYDSNATEPGDCTYQQQHYDCFGNCVDTDCFGNCPPVAILDQCGVCNGDNDCFPDFVNLVNVYPNPFSEFLNVVYELPEQTNVKISIFDINGSLIDILFNESQYGRQNPYEFTWDPGILPSGVYILNFETKFKSVSEKITLLK